MKLSSKQRKELEGVIKAKEKADEVLRAQAILMLDNATSIETIREITGFKRRQTFLLRKRFLDEGLDSITDKRKGKPKELLSKQQREEIIQIIKTKTPKNLGYVHDFWTTGILADHIKTKYKVSYKSKTSLYVIFKGATFSYHTPARRYDLQDKEEIKKFKRKARKTIEKHWYTNTVILSEDEMVLTTATTIQKVWLPKGESPYIEVRTGTKHRAHIYGFLNIKDGTEHAFKTEKQNMFVTVEVLEKVRTLYKNKHILLFWDNAGWHLGSAVQNWIKKDDNLEIVHFPKYTPEENPQEHVWKKGRGAITHNKYIEDLEKTSDELVSYFNSNAFSYSLAGFSASS